MVWTNSDTISHVMPITLNVNWVDQNTWMQTRRTHLGYYDFPRNTGWFMRCGHSCRKLCPGSL